MKDQCNKKDDEKMKQTKYFPVIYGVISALIAFIAVFFIAQRTFHFSVSMAILSAGIFAAFFYVLSYFRGNWVDKTIDIEKMNNE